MRRYLNWISLYFIFILVFVASIVFLFFDEYRSISFIVFLVDLPLLFVFVIPLIYWDLAPLNRFFTYVTEGLCKFVVKGGAVSNILIQLKGFTFDEEWNLIPEGWYKNGKSLEKVSRVISEYKQEKKKMGVIEIIKTETDPSGNVVEVSEEIPDAVLYKEKKHLLGGLRVYGIWPIWDIYLYRFRWTSPRQDGTPEDHDQVLDAVLLKYHQYIITVEEAETIKGETIPLDINLVVVMRVINPYKAIFKVQDWLEMISNRIKPILREFVSQYTFVELIEQKQTIKDKLWKQLIDDGLIAEFRDDYGIEVKEGEIEMRDIIAPPEYQEAATKRYLGEKESEKRAEETIGSVIQMMALATGRSIEDVRKEIQSDTNLRKEVWSFCQDLIHRRMAIDGSSYVDIRVTGAGGVEKTLLDIITAWRRMPAGKPGKREKINEIVEKMKES